ncbi:GntR family transcriptional regulator [Lewinella sp. 4G2]|uniref:GntR family transcriptional regulator n=1 Tax=Lewinella sp. 4G2 TaxID=1803372 RepID=UPI0007B4C17C|nr:GntR family transcriptional regulator [Lewinella sp. 4G2]OAV45798.1 transcriptional regulator [Lewinella sp. 4G2]
MLLGIKVQHNSITPIYQQIVNSVVHGIEVRDFQAGDKLPSINVVSARLDIARGTVEKAYRELRERQVIDSVQGKGYFIRRADLRTKRRVFLIFNKLSAHKKLIYDAFVETLGPEVIVDFFVYNNSFPIFRDLLLNAGELHTHYVIIGHFYGGEQKAVELINELPKHKLVILDKEIPGLKGNYAAIYQPFEKDIQRALNQAIEPLRKYPRLKIIFPHDTYHPKAILNGFQRFVIDHGFRGYVVSDISDHDIEVGDAYITLMEADLVTLIKRVKDAGHRVGKDIGILSYNDSPLKEILLDGISTLSTDFAGMGRRAAEMILNKEVAHEENAFNLVLRNSL